KRWLGHGRPTKRMRRDAKHRPMSVKELALKLASSAWRKVTWREGAAARLSSRFARVRVRAAHRDYRLSASRSEEWLLIEWPKGEKEPTKYWLSILPEDISFHPRGELFPPRQLLPKFSSRNLPFPKVIDPEAPPLRPERHVPNSIATLRRRLIVKLVANLSRCPCCALKIQARSRRTL